MHVFSYLSQQRPKSLKHINPTQSQYLEVNLSLAKLLQLFPPKKAQSIKFNKKSVNQLLPLV